MNNSITINTGGCATGVTSSSSCCWEPWQNPELVETRVYQDRIELIYRQEPSFTYTSTGFHSQPPPRITRRTYKIESMTEDEGKWIEPSDGYYEFNEEL